MSSRIVFQSRTRLFITSVEADEEKSNEEMNDGMKK
jgi:hypothetical protein